MFAAQKPIAPAIASPPLRRVPDVVDRRPRAGGERRRQRREPPDQYAEALAARERGHPPLEVLGQQRDREEDQDHRPGDRRRDRRQLEVVAAVENLRPQQDPVDHQAEHVDGVEEDEEGDHPAGGLRPLHPRLAERPVGEDDAARAAGREQPRRRQPGHRDLVRLAPVQVQHVLADDAAEEGDVGREGADVEGERDDDPGQVPLSERGERVVEPDDLREEDVDRGDEQADDQEGLHAGACGSVRSEGSCSSPSSSASAVAASSPGPDTWPWAPPLPEPDEGVTLTRTLPRLADRSRPAPRSRVRDPLEALDRVAEGKRQRLEVGLAAAHERHQGSARDQVGDVVLAEVDEREPERPA